MKFPAVVAAVVLPQRFEPAVLQLPRFGQHQTVGAAQRDDAGGPAVQIADRELVARIIVIGHVHPVEQLPRRPRRTGDFPAGHAVEHHHVLLAGHHLAFVLALLLPQVAGFGVERFQDFGFAVAVHVVDDVRAVPDAAFDIPAEISGPQDRAVTFDRLQHERMLRRLPEEIPRIDIRIAVAHHEVIFAVAVKIADADFVDPRFRITELVGNIGVALELSGVHLRLSRSPGETGGGTHQILRPRNRILHQKIGGLHHRSRIELLLFAIRCAEHVEADFRVVGGEQPPRQIDALLHRKRHQAAVHFFHHALFRKSLHRAVFPFQRRRRRRKFFQPEIIDGQIAVPVPDHPDADPVPSGGDGRHGRKLFPRSGKPVQPHPGKAVIDQLPFGEAHQLDRRAAGAVAGLPGLAGDADRLSRSHRNAVTQCKRPVPFSGGAQPRGPVALRRVTGHFRRESHALARPAVPVFRSLPDCILLKVGAGELHRFRLPGTVAL